MSQLATIGRIVHYKLSDTDVAIIRDRRISTRTSGNSVAAGDVFPAIVIRRWGDTLESSIQLQVFLDGNDTFWATSVSEGDGERQWSWPPRV